MFSVALKFQDFGVKSSQALTNEPAKLRWLALSRPRETNHRGTPYNDGTITRWSTFDKCYWHTELKHLIEDTLGVPARYLKR